MKSKGEGRYSKSEIKFTDMSPRGRSAQRPPAKEAFPDRPPGGTGLSAKLPKSRKEELRQAAASISGTGLSRTIRKSAVRRYDV